MALPSYHFCWSCDFLQTSSLLYVTAASAHLTGQPTQPRPHLRKDPPLDPPDRDPAILAPFIYYSNARGKQAIRLIRQKVGDYISVSWVIAIAIATRLSPVEGRFQTADLLSHTRTLRYLPTICCKVTRTHSS